MAAVKDLTLDEVQLIVQDESAWKVVNSLINKGYISVYENLNENYKPKRENYVFLTKGYEVEAKLKELMSVLEKAPKQLNLLLVFLHLNQTEAGVLQRDLLKHADANVSQLKALQDKGVFDIRKIIVDRMSYEYTGERLVNTLDDFQQQAYEAVNQGFSSQKPVLLKGVTGSGKTHIYFKLIEDCIQAGRQALYLLPEIALTAQIIRKLRSYFGDRVGIYHSRFSQNERLEVWQKVLRGEYDIVIGARSALLLPFKDPGLIIVDEEHDTSYKQHEPAPHYHARDAAIVLARQHRAQIILGSATPSLESFYNAEQKKYHLVNLEKRYGTAVLPEVKLIDTKAAIASKMQQGIFSNQLIQAIQKALEQKKQVILFQNRRGYAPLVMCSMCGWIPHCKFCDVSLTYHKQTDQLHCHYCGTRSAYIKICQACGGNRIISKSFGTEKIEDDIKKIFPFARVQRFDWDALRIKNKYQEIIRQFEKREIDILVGTQMVVKGLDFEHVNLVGVLSADSLLSQPDFRVNERVFQLLSQVGGRAGRKLDIGEVLIQLYKTDHPTIRRVQQHDYQGFYEEEMQSRHEFMYPPYTRLIRITLKHKNQQTVADAARKLGEQILTLQQVQIFGPAEPSVSRIRNYYLQEILLKVKRESEILAQIKGSLRQHISLLTTMKNFTQVRVVVDVDPY
ncbi:MAG: primosomal protein N' [Chitinophagaceae bacterium]|nr:primosomal protein N' [Chitinophagaceae bacterium]